MSEYPVDGDNFRLIGPWRINTGCGWRAWRREALIACKRASIANGDEMIAHALERKIQILEFSEFDKENKRNPEYSRNVLKLLK